MTHTKSSLGTITRNISSLAAAVWLWAAPAVSAQTTWTAGGGTDKEWENATWSNWSTGASPAGQNVIFGNAGAAGVSTTVTNIVDQSFTIGSLTYNQNTTTPTDNAKIWQNTQINSGVTLTVGGGLTIGGVTVTSATGQVSTRPVTTNTAFSGAGTLTVNAAASDINVWNNRSVGSVGAPSAALDLSGLAGFNATVANFNIGYGASSIGTVSLANTSNVITASTFSVGNANGNTAQGTGTLHLGAGTNTLNAASIYVGASSGTNINGSNGTLDFLTGTGTLTIRGQTGGTSRANLTIGSQRAGGSGSNTAGNATGTVDFGTHTVDALINNLLLGSSGAGAAGAGATGTLSFGAGTLDVTTAIIGQTGFGGDGDANTAVGTLNINGGTFTAGTVTVASNTSNFMPVTGNLNIAGGASTINSLVMGSRTGSVGTAVSSNVTVSGGALTVNSNLAEGSNGSDVTSRLTLSGGSLDMANHSITVDIFTVQSGTLSNVSQFNAGATLTKTTGGTLTLAGTNAYTGNTVVSAGTLLVDGTLSQSAVTVADTATLGGSGTIAQAVMVAGGGTIAPGNSAGILSTGNLSLASGAAVSMQLNGAAAGSGYDQLNVTGTVNLNSDSGAGSDLVLALNYAPVDNQTFTLIVNDGSEAMAGAFATINGAAFGPGNTFSLVYDSRSYDFTLTYGGGTGNDLVIQAVPEPAAWLLAAFAGGVAMSFRLRRQRALRISHRMETLPDIGG